MGRDFKDYANMLIFFGFGLGFGIRNSELGIGNWGSRYLGVY